MTSSGPHLCYRQLAPTTGILFANFFVCNDLEYLLTSTVNNLSIYAVRRSKTGHASLLLVRTYNLYGRVAGVAYLNQKTLDGKTEHRIVVTLDEGKISVLEFDPRCNALITRLMFNAEDGGIGEGSEVHADSKGRKRSPGLYGNCPATIVDDLNGVACTLLYGDQLFFFSLRHSLLSVFDDKPISPFIFDLCTCCPFPNIFDMCFLSKTGQPTIAILLSPEAIPIGHAKYHSHRVSVVFFSVDVATASLSMLWRVDGLPNDSHQLIPIRHHPHLSSAVLVVGLNACIMLSYNKVCGFAVNGLAGITVSPSIPLKPYWDLSSSHGPELDDSKWMQVDGQTFICSLKDGKLMSVSLANFNSSNVNAPSNFECKVLADCVLSSCLAFSRNADVWFIGSCNGDSILLTVAISSDLQIKNKVNWAVVGANATPSLKRRRLSKGSASTPLSTNGNMTPIASSSLITDEIANLIDAEENFLYGMGLKDMAMIENISRHSKYELQVTDVIYGLGPALNGLTYSNEESLPSSSVLHWGGQSSKMDGPFHSAAAYIADREVRDGFQLSCGTGKAGVIVKLYSGYKVSKVAARDFGDCINVNSITLSYDLCKELIPGFKESTMPEAALTPPAHKACSLLFVSLKRGATKILLSSGTLDSAESKAPKKQHGLEHHHIIANGAHFVELSVQSVGFVGEHITICTGTICLSSICIQITPIGIRVTEFSGCQPTPLQDVLVEEDMDIGGLGGSSDEVIVQGDVVDCGEKRGGYVAVLTSRGNIYILQFDTTEKVLQLLQSTNFKNNCSSSSNEFAFAPAGAYNCVSLYYGWLNVSVSKQVSEDNVMDLSHHVQSTPRVRRAQSNSTVVDERIDTPPLDKSASSRSHKSSGIRKLRDAGVRIEDIVSEEERCLYGEQLKADNLDGTSQMCEGVEACDRPDSDAYLILCDQNSELHCIRLSDMSYYFCTESLGLGKDHLELNSSRSKSIAPTLSNDRVCKVLDVCMSDIGRQSSVSGCHNNTDISRLTIVAALDTGDAVVYTSNNVSQDTPVIQTFVKVSHSVLSRRHNRRERIKRVFSNTENSYSSPKSPLEDPLIFALRRYSQLDGRRGVICNGLRPLVVLNDNGLPAVLPLSLPELPFSSAGYYSVAPAVYSGGLYRGLTVLWVEVKMRNSDAFADGYGPSVSYGDAHSTTKPPPPPPRTMPPRAIDLIQPPLPSTPRPPPVFTVASVLGMYKEVKDLLSIPNAPISMKKVKVGQTIRHIQEIAPRTDEKIQLALLRRKTFLMTAAVVTDSEFRENVFTEEEMIEDKANYDRFFPSLKSFGETSIQLGPPPSIKREVHSVLLVQNNSVVDEYCLPETENILGMEILYLSVPIIEQGAHPNVPRRTKKVIYIVVSTCIDDGHGDDTQAEGRILLLALDYALYEGTEAANGVSAEQKENNNDAVDRIPIGSAANEKKTLETNAAPDLATIPTNLNLLTKEQLLLEIDKHGRTDITMKSLKQDMIDALTACLISKSTEMDISESIEMSTENVSQSKSFTDIKEDPDIKGMPQSSNAQANFLESIQPKLKLLWAGPGPSTVVKQLGDRYVVTTLGSILYVYNINPATSELDQLSFYFAPFYITSVNIIKNYIIIGDSVQGLQFLQWIEEDSVVSLVAKDYEALLSLLSSYIVDGNRLGMISADIEGNIQLLQYNPRVLESRKGFKLLCLSDFYLGSTATMFVPHRLLSRPQKEPTITHTSRLARIKGGSLHVSASGVRFEKTGSPKTCVLVGTVYGEIGVLIPIDEGVHKRLLLLQQIMGSVMNTTCGLNPREYRFIKTSGLKLERKRGLLDGTLLWRFMDLDVRTQDELCAAMGTTADIVSENLLEIDRMWCFF